MNKPTHERRAPSPTTDEVEVAVIGAGQAGLAMGYFLRRRGRGFAILEQAELRGLGFSSFVSIGNKADVSTNDLLEHWEDDDDTGLVLL